MPRVPVRRVTRWAAAVVVLTGMLGAGPASASPVAAGKRAVVVVASARGHLSARATGVRFKDASGPALGQSVTFTTKAGVGASIRRLSVLGPIKVTIELFVRSHGRSRLDEALTLTGARVAGLTSAATGARVKLSFTTVTVSTG